VRIIQYFQKYYWYTVNIRFLPSYLSWSFCYLLDSLLLLARPSFFSWGFSIASFQQKIFICLFPKFINIQKSCYCYLQNYCLLISCDGLPFCLVYVSAISSNRAAWFLLLPDMISELGSVTLLYNILWSYIQNNSFVRLLLSEGGFIHKGMLTYLCLFIPEAEWTLSQVCKTYLRSWYPSSVRETFLWSYPGPVALRFLPVKVSMKWNCKGNRYIH